MRVLHVTGAGRSGSTLLGSMLGQIPGFCNVGEAGYLWERGLAAGGACGCGRPVRLCPVWSAVLERAFPELDELAELARRHRAATRGWRVMAAALPGHAVPAPGDHLRLLARLYRALAEVTGCAVVVDSTKPAPYGHLLARTPDVELKVVHLVRDPRAVAWSWQRRKAGEGADAMAVRPAWQSALLWHAGNRAAARLSGDDYLLLRYEDLVAEPEHWLRRVARLVGHAEPEIPEIDADGVLLRPTHTVAGNVDRHRTGRTPLRLDSQWAGAMPAATRRLVELLTFPAGRRYGYHR
ncbi:sulfotransferase [Nonomuraea antimicrobica]|uniref:Sulfotransferase n=1 Tax=Nonomuraea antimicrobica TaxID=561173 RepID=A0ABP7BT00_9ACTN